MIYTKFIKSRKIFSRWFNRLYAGKKKTKGNILIKSILNVWGYLCAYSKKLKLKESTIESWSDDKMMKFDYIPYKIIKGEQYYHVQKKTNIYQLNIARLKPFLMSTAKQRMRENVKNNLNEIVRIYIDGIISTEDIPSLENKTESIKYDKYHKKDVEIKALNDINILN